MKKVDVIKNLEAILKSEESGLIAEEKEALQIALQMIRTYFVDSVKI